MFEPGCALHSVASGIVEELPLLERLFIVWYDEDDASIAFHCLQSPSVAFSALLTPSIALHRYDEDDVDADGCARALAPLNACAGLREVHLIRDDSNCGAMDAPNSATSAAAALRQALPAVWSVRLTHAPQQSSTDR